MSCFEPNVGYLDAGVTDAAPNGAFLADPMACQAACEAAASCAHFTFRETASAPGVEPVLAPGACWLLGAEVKPQEKPGLISGPKVCPTEEGGTTAAPGAATTPVVVPPAAPSPSEEAAPEALHSFFGVPWPWIFVVVAVALGLIWFISTYTCGRKRKGGAASRHKRRAKERMERAAEQEMHFAPKEEVDPLLPPGQPAYYPVSFPGAQMPMPAQQAYPQFAAAPPPMMVQSQPQYGFYQAQPGMQQVRYPA